MSYRTRGANATREGITASTTFTLYATPRRQSMGGVKPKQKDVSNI